MMTVTPKLHVPDFRLEQNYRNPVLALFQTTSWSDPFPNVPQALLTLGLIAALAPLVYFLVSALSYPTLCCKRRKFEAVRASSSHHRPEASGNYGSHASSHAHSHTHANSAASPGPAGAGGHSQHAASRGGARPSAPPSPAVTPSHHAARPPLSSSSSSLSSLASPRPAASPRPQQAGSGSQSGFHAAAHPGPHQPLQGLHQGQGIALHLHSPRGHPLSPTGLTPPTPTTAAAAVAAAAAASAAGVNGRHSSRASSASASSPSSSSSSRHAHGPLRGPPVTQGQGGHVLL